MASEDDVGKLLMLFELCTDYFAQDEIGKKYKTPHIQGCISLKYQKTMSALVKKWLPHAHLEPCYKSLVANKRYCLKDETRAPNGRRWVSEEKTVNPIKKSWRKPYFPAWTLYFYRDSDGKLIPMYLDANYPDSGCDMMY